MIKIVDYLRLNLLQNEVERIQAQVANLRQPGCLWETRSSGERYDDMEEETVIKTNEQPQTALDGQGKRFNHGGTFYKTSSPTSVSPAPVTDEGQLGQGNSIKVNSTK